MSICKFNNRNSRGTFANINVFISTAMHIEKPWVFSKDERASLTELDLQMKFWGFVFETYFGSNKKTKLRW
jgi:hypothetical protein